MAGRIQGITVEIGGDTTKLQTALKGVNTEIRNTQSQLRDVDKLLKLDPGNTELLAQKHRLLGDAVKETKEKLETLKTVGDNVTNVGKKFMPVTLGVVGLGTAAAESLVGKNAMSGFLALMNAGEADIEKLSSAIDNCDGSAASMAETMNDNLAGQLQILKSQLEELAISFGELLMPAIRTIVGWIQKFVDWLNSMDEGTRKVIVTIALVAAAIGPILIIVGKVISAVGTQYGSGRRRCCRGYRDPGIYRR